MKVSLNKLRYINEHEDTGANLVPSDVDDLVVRIGAQLGAVEEVVPYGKGLDAAIIVKVVGCEKHPDADKLSLCRVDDGGVVRDVERGDDGLVQVVCGAPNVKAGMLAAWLPPGSTVPSTIDHDPFVLEARELRGKVSNGMLASPKELGIGDTHEGIVEVDKDVELGSTFAKAYLTDGEMIINIENKMFTHRPDCFGIMGVAREIAGIQGQSFKSPSWYVPNPEFPTPSSELPLGVLNELPELVPRFTAITLSGVKIQQSPIWLQIVLNEVGIRPINNIVDYTNFWMLETGQPLHAYDYDKVKALSDGDPAIVIRNPKKGEKLKLLNGKEIEPRAEAIMIANDKQLIGIGGVMGGSETEVDDNTTNIILECANFDMYSIRRTSMVHGLFTDAVTRFTKGQSPLQNLAVLAKITDTLVQELGAKIASNVIDDNHVDKEALQRNSLYPSVKLSSEFINVRLGLKLTAAQIKKLLNNVEFKVDVAAEELEITAPFWRTDIEIPEDIVEEVGRLYGFDKLPLELPKLDLTPAEKDPMLETKATIRDRLSKAGANEVLTYSFVHGNLLEKTGQDKSKAFEISSALSPDLQYYRLSLMPSLLEKVHPNSKAGYGEFALFEVGKTHGIDYGEDDDGLPKEHEFTGLVVTANNKLKKIGAAYYQAQKYLQALIDSDLEFKPISEDMKNDPVIQPYDLKRSAFVMIKGGDFLGIIGEFKPSVRAALKLPNYTAGFEVDTSVLQNVIEAGPSYLPLLRFPAVKQDLTLKVGADLPYSQLRGLVNKAYGAHAPKNTHIALEPVDIYQDEAAKESKHITFRFTTTGLDRTLTDKEINKLLDDVVAEVGGEIPAERL